MPVANQPFYFLPIIHAHQPSGNFERVFEQCYRDSYEPFLCLIERHPNIHLALHYSGPLLLWIERTHPEYFDRLRALVASGRIEMIGGGFYEPILISIPEIDQVEQINRLASYLESNFARRPNGIWLAERVWESSLPASLSRAGVQYTVIDDLPFLAAGFEPAELYGPYIAEDRGKSIWLFPGLKELRYLIPFRMVSECIDYFRRAAETLPGGAATFGDDMEKFGVWPGTHQHCYENSWLDQFFTALDDNSSWLQTATPTEYMARHLPLGRADLPSGSYAEMMEWVLPTPTRQRFYALQREFAYRPDLLGFLHGGSWRGFLRKYPEANLMHKKMLRASACVAGIRTRFTDDEHLSQTQAARDSLLRAQGNDAYWHGVFGGLYAPHLRTEVWRNLVKAESLADQLSPSAGLARVEMLDFDCDGRSELLFTAPEYQALLKPSDGATLAFLDFRPASATVINSVLRRPESYHSRVRDAAARQQGASPVSIHDQLTVKEPNLERFLRYDRYPRHSFRILLFTPDRSVNDYDALELAEIPTLAGGSFDILSSNENSVTLSTSVPLPEFSSDLADPPVLSVRKQFVFGPAPHGFEISCDLDLSLNKPLDRSAVLGVESIVNFLAPSESDRFFDSPQGQHPLRFSGALPAPILRVEDGWQRMRAIFHAPGAAGFWVSPIETVSESEGGFERVYQGSQILALWQPDLTKDTSFVARLLLRMELF